MTNQADLSITKTASPSSYAPGSPLTYTLTVSNGGPSDVVGAIVTDVVPAALAAFGWTCVSGCSPSSGTGSISTSVSVAAGGSAVITLTGTVPGGTSGTLSNTASVAAPSGVTDPNGANNTATATTPLVAQADLSITKTASRSSYVAGSPLTYTITVSNGGPAAAVGATVSDVVPAALSAFGWTCSPGCAPSSGTGNVSASVSLAAGASAVITLTGTVPPKTKGTVVNTATVAAPSGLTDPNLANNSATRTTPKAGSPPPPPPPPSSGPSADVSVTKTGPGTANVGDAVAFSLVVRNNGPDAATSVVVKDSLPAELAYVSATGPSGVTCSASGQTVTCGTALLAASASITITVQVRVTGGAGGSVTNVGAVSAATADPTAANNSSSTSLAIGSPPPPKPTPKPKPRPGARSPRLSLSKHWLMAQVRAGETARVQITVANTGKVVAENVEVCDLGSKQLSFVAAPGAFYRRGSACWRVGRLAPGERRTFTVVARVDRTVKGKMVVNVATATASNVGAVAPARASIRVKPARGKGRPGGVTG